MTSRTGTQIGAVTRVKTTSKTRLAPNPEGLLPTFTQGDTKPPFLDPLERGSRHCGAAGQNGSP